MNSTQIFVNDLIRRFESNCSSAQQRLANHKTIPEVVRAGQVRADPIIRSMTRSLPGYRQLQTALERKLESLVDEQLAAVSAEPDIEKRKEMLGKLRHREWDALRGYHAMVWRRADSGAQRLLRP